MIKQHFHAVNLQNELIPPHGLGSDNSGIATGRIYIKKGVKIKTPQKMERFLKVV